MAEIVHGDLWIISKSAIGPMNSTKNKLNSKINLLFNFCQTYTITKVMYLNFALFIFRLKSLEPWDEYANGFYK